MRFDRLPQIKHFIGLGFVVVLVYITINSIRVYDSVFTGPTREAKMTEWDSYLQDRKQRNAKAMKISYEDLILIGYELVERKDWPEAQEAFNMAKSIYPKAMEPRVQLCYIFLQMCKYDGSYCRYGKREIYFAMKHVDENDEQSLSYLEQLIDHANIHDLIALEESMAMSEIFN